MSFHLIYSLLLLQFVFGYAPFEHKSPGIYVFNVIRRILLMADGLNAV